MQKIPEQGIKLDEDYTDLPCANTHSLLVMYDDFFKILGILYDKTNLRKGSTQPYEDKLYILQMDII